MVRTTIMADDALLRRLRSVARRDGVSLAEVIRQGMEWRASHRPARGGAAARGPLGRMAGTGVILGDVESPAAEEADWKALVR